MQHDSTIQFNTSNSNVKCKQADSYAESGTLVCFVIFTQNVENFVVTSTFTLQFIFVF